MNTAEVDTGPPPEMRRPGGKPGPRETVDFRADDQHLPHRLADVHLSRDVREDMSRGNWTHVEPRLDGRLR